MLMTGKAILFLIKQPSMNNNIPVLLSEVKQNIKFITSLLISFFELMT